MRTPAAPVTGPDQRVRLAMWSGPRNLSTALMRAWENREDCVVVDEPLYASYLARTGLDHPGREEVIAAQPTDVATAVAGLSAPLPDGVRVHYTKHMAHHLPDDLDLSWTRLFRNVLLVRDPGEVVASYVRARQACEPADIGLLQQVRLLEAWDEVPPVLDAGDFLRDPEAHLRWLCDWLEVPFTDRMLSWPAGRRESDGVWAPHWYDAVERSTGFEPWRAREVRLGEHDAAVAEACRPAYERLHALRVRV
ncbi:MAG TPA: HAD family hydrolase [Nocardioidaceae bacterium]|nr:HAD family hydrolase [Nocardioidaceae bacterium]